jgi:hypothetical protein
MSIHAVQISIGETFSFKYPKPVQEAKKIKDETINERSKINEGEDRNTRTIRKVKVE